MQLGDWTTRRLSNQLLAAGTSIGANLAEAASGQTRADFIRGLESNSGLAAALADFETLRGGWEKLFEEVGRIQAVTREQVQAAARTYLTKDNATIGYMLTEGNKETAER